MTPILQFLAYALVVLMFGAPARAQEVKAGDLVITQAWSRATPGGYHLMLQGLKSPLKQGDKVPVTLEFEKAGKVKL
ncbi:MAG: periplasmic copper chaperone, partial [Alphaproteobacteria bacterium]|nr:periplasmic copper chaperone [Alphaproteobacteria bacterium]